MKYIIIISLFFSASLPGFAQFAPPAGVAGTTAIFKDSSVFVSWAKTCVVTRGFVKISDTNFVYHDLTGNFSNHAFYGIDQNGTGKSDDTLVVSLGDGGSAVLTFDGVIRNGTGYDFAVFENGLSDTFLELGFVEVSSDGINFFRFPSTSLTDPTLQVGTFGNLDATKIDNLAGKYRYQYGTPFDLDTLKGISGLDISRISHVRIVDVVGCIQPLYASHDSHGNVVNDLWPTPFNTCGFDLDAVGVIYLSPQGLNEPDNHLIGVFPNPVGRNMTVTCSGAKSVDLSLSDLSGKIVFHRSGLLSNTTFDLSELSGGMYIATFTFSDGTSAIRKIIKQ